MSRRLVPTEVAAVALAVRPATIRKWFQRGALTRYGSVRHALVDLAECEARVFGDAA